MIASDIPDESEHDSGSGEQTASNEVPRAEQERLFRQLVSDHQTRLYRWVLKHIGQADDAADIAQQAFVEASKAIATFRGESELSTWLYGIAMNLVRNYLTRAPHRVHQFESEETLEEMPGDETDPGEQVANAQMMRHLYRELEALPDEMREVLLLVAVEEITYEDAAVMLSIPVGTVRSRVFRARAALRERFRKAGVELDF
ncbi:RNA polymerase sigma factor [Parachitinimonas caeni]|uniref:RNA polymerase sigma factor n=1 Tax=Parachitinimonas caeni TaxID=3031301 RepID=A0ABT7DZJ7_9NEIS|nr:RNA polymerase sigma factor [Parachitinimonas caeni]MDK2124077.1 RNA polymerase sigma factor [Parachitinimonas caeni]